MKKLNIILFGNSMGINLLWTEEANQKTVEGLGKIKLLHIEGTGHNLHHDDLEATTRETRSFFAANNL